MSAHTPIRASAMRVAGAAGVAGLATAMATAGGASASPAPSAPAPSASAVHNSARSAPLAPAATSTSTAAPDYGTRKIRVGVQIDPAADVPDGTNTIGSEITIVETGPNADPDPQTSHCNTDASTVVDPATASYCVFDYAESEVRRASAARGLAPDDSLSYDDYYYAAPEDSVTITQTTVNDDLVIDSSTKTFGPTCDLNPDDSYYCVPDEALFTDEGFPPVAKNDTASTQENTPVTIDNLDNDSLGGAHTATITDLTQPKHGKATIVTDEASDAHGAIRVAALAGTTQSLMYTPSHGFVGVDPFTYNLTTANGTSKATVTVTVVGPTTTTSAPPTSSAPSTSPATSASSSATLIAKPPIAETGTDSGDELLIALGLLGAGGAFATAGRRRRARGRHAD